VSPALNRLLLRLGRWPRRVAVAVCVVLAVSSSLDGHGHASVTLADPLARLKAGQVAVPVTLNQSGTEGIIEAGNHVGLFSANSVVADHLLVLRVVAVPAGDDGTASILVAADRPTALRIARSSAQSMLAVVDKSP
jgi:hypothetical protein